jgi:hypothetical protein
MFALARRSFLDSEFLISFRTMLDFMGGLTQGQFRVPKSLVAGFCKSPENQ